MRSMEKQVALDIKNYEKSGQLPKAWDYVKVSSRTGSDYWDYIRKHNQGMEPLLRRVDALSDEDTRGIWDGNTFRGKATEWIHENGPELFSVREMLVYSLVYVDGLGEQDTADRLGISQQRVSEIKGQIKRKLFAAIDKVL